MRSASNFSISKFSLLVRSHHVEFCFRSLLFSMTVQTRQNTRRVYTLSVARLPGEIEVERCSIKYQRGGCWITLIKSQPLSWMNRICDDLNPGLDIQENEGENDANSQASAPPEEEKQLRETSMPAPFSLVPLAPPPPGQKSSHAPT